MSIPVIHVNKYFIVWVLCFVSLIFIANLFPLYYETGNDVFSKLISSGHFFEQPEGVVSSYGSYVLLSDFYAILYRISPHVHWFDIFNLGYWAIILTNLIFLLIPLWISNNSWVRFFCLGVFFIVGQNLIFSETTRLGFLLSSTSILMLHRFVKITSIQKISLIIFSLLGVMVRVEAGILSVGLVLMIGWIYSQDRKGFIIQQIPLVVLIIGLLFFVNWQRNDTESRYMSIRPYQFSLWDFNMDHHSLQLENDVDSIKFFTSKQFFLADEEALSPLFFEKIGVVPVDKTPGYFINYFTNLSSLKSKVSFHWKALSFDVIFLFSIWLILLITVLIHTTQKRKSFIVFMMGLMVLLTISFLMKMEVRLLYPFVGVCMLILVLFSFYEYNEIKLKSISKYYFSSFSILVFILFIVKTKDLYHQKSTSSKEMESIHNRLGVLPDSSIVLLNLTTLVNWESRYFEKIKLDSQLKFIPYDNGLMFSQNGTRKMYDHYFGCQEFECISRKIFESDDVYFVSDSNRLLLMKSYLRGVYDIDLIVDKIYTHPMYRKTTNQSIELYKVTNPKVI